MSAENSNVHDTTIRRSLRRRASTDFAGPYHFPSQVPSDAISQPVKHGSRCPRRRRQVFHDATSEPVKHGRGRGRGRGRPRRHLPVSSCAASKKLPAVPSPPMPPIVSSGVAPLPVPISTEAPLPSPGSTKDGPLEIPCDEEEEKKINLNLLSMLSPPPYPQSRCPSHITEESKSMISKVKSVLVFQLISGSTGNIEAMVKCANNAFSNLDYLEADYASFYKDVTDFISYQCDLLTANRQRKMQSFPELETRYEDAILCANDLKDKIIHTQGQLETAMEKKEPLKRRMADAMKEIDKLKQCIAILEEDEDALKHKKKEYIVAHKIAQHEVEKLCSKVKATKNVLMEIDRRKYVALSGIESTICRLKSAQS